MKLCLLFVLTLKTFTDGADDDYLDDDGDDDNGVNEKEFADRQRHS